MRASEVQPRQWALKGNHASGDRFGRNCGTPWNPGGENNGHVSARAEWRYAMPMPGNKAHIGAQISVEAHHSGDER